MEINKKFISLIEKEPFIIRYKELNKLINNNKTIKEKYNKLIELQKKMLKYKDKTIETEYENLKMEILEIPFMEEYFDLVNEIEAFLQEVKNIIELEL